MQIIIKMTVLLAILFSGTLASAKKIDETELRAIQKKLKASDHLQVRFYRTTYKALRGRKTKSRGEAWFSRPNLFLWTVKDPLPDELYYNGKEFVSYRPAEKFAFVCPQTSKNSDQFSKVVDLVLNFDSLLKDWELLDAQINKKNHVKLQLTPRKKNSIKKISMSISLQMNFIESLRLDHETGNYTEFEFKKPIFEKIPKSTYDFKKKKGDRLRACKS